MAGKNVYPTVVVMALLASLGGWRQAALADTPTTPPAPTTESQPLAPYALPEIAQFALNDGQLEVTFDVPAELRSTSAMPFRVERTAAAWTVKMADKAAELTYADSPDVLREGQARITLSVDDRYVSISALYRHGGDLISVLYRCRATDRLAQFEAYVTLDGALCRTLINTQAASLYELWARHPQEVDIYLSPLLKKMSRQNLLGPGAADVYAAFEDIEADPKLTRRLEQLLPHMAHPSVDVRERASAELHRLGRPGVLAAMRYGSATLCPEQRSRVGAFINAHRLRPLNATGAASGKLEFLMECLEDADLEVRVAAKHAIERINGVMLAYNPEAGVDERANSVRAMRTGQDKGAAVTTAAP